MEAIWRPDDTEELGAGAVASVPAGGLHPRRSAPICIGSFSGPGRIRQMWDMLWDPAEKNL